MGGFVAQSNCAMLIEAQGMTEAKSVKARDKKTNWAECNGALNKARGSLPIWLNKDMQGYASASGKRGGQRVFSDVAIAFGLRIQCLFGLPCSDCPKRGTSGDTAAQERPTVQGQSARGVRAQ